jgi:hypothetical protein
MGIDLHCNDKKFSCSYGHWYEIRTEIIKATFDFIQDRFDKDNKLYSDLTDDNENWIGKGSTYYSYMTDLIEIKTQIFESNDLFDKFIRLSHNLHVINTLIYFDIIGLVALCNKSDCEGFYSSGNSFDICYLFDKIEPFVKKYSCYNCIYSDKGIIFDKLYDVFEYSYKTIKKVIIT